MCDMYVVTLGQLYELLEDHSRIAFDVVYSGRLIQRLLGDMNLKSWIGEHAVVEVLLVRCVRDWNSYIASLRIDPEGGLLYDNTGIHCFLFMRRKGALIRCSPQRTT
jgi:hypothetical protein